MMNMRCLLPILSTCLALAACGGPAANTDSPQGELIGARIGAPFTLTDQNGQPRTWDSFKGKYRIVYFGYTYCPDVCPVDLQKIAAGYGAFEKAHPARAAKVQPIFISIDPERDTPDVLKTYVAAFHPKLVGLTGSPDQIAKVAKDFVVVYGKSDPKLTKDYLVDHSRTPYLFGPDGAPIALIPVDDPATGGDDGDAEAIVAALDRYVQ